MGYLSWLNRSSFARNVSWNVLGNAGGKLLGPLFQVLIARLLLPADFGVFAIALAWLAMFEIGKDWGLSHAIVVRRGGKLETDLQFTVQIGTALAFYLVTLAVGPIAAKLFGLPELGTVLAIVGLIAFISAVADPIVTGCLVSQRYRLLAIRQMMVPLVSGAIGYFMAHMGFGVYSLVFGLVAGHATGALSLVLGQRTGRMKFSMDLALTRQLMSVAKHILMQRFFGFLVGQADTFIVGKALGPQALGTYRMANLLVFLLPAATVAQAQQVVFTELSARPSEESIRGRYNHFTNVAGTALLLYSIAVYVLAPILVPWVLGESWRNTVPLMQIFAAVVITGFTTPLNIDLAKVLGFINIYTRFAIVRSVVTVIAILVAAQYSILHVVLAWVLVGFVANFANDAIFYSRQGVVKLTYGKVLITATSWAWALFVIGQAMPW